ncbi:MAG: hypothetical protein N3J91_10010 [Verrucomicrobiae bacterium]|nr:hypothetical protein [Verrucomicrobiae bacterium]
MRSINIRSESLFHTSAATILCLTAVCKLISVTGEARVMALADPIIRFVSLRQLLLWTALLELGVAWYLFNGRNIRARNYLLLWLCGLFIAYRVGLWLMQYKGCSCLGTVTQWLPVSAGTVDLVMKLILAYLGIGSAVFIWKSLGKDGSKQVDECQPIA